MRSCPGDVAGLDQGGAAAAEGEAVSRPEAYEDIDAHRQILDSAIDYAIIAADLEGRIWRWNRGAEAILGWTEAEMAGQAVDRFFTPEDRAADIPAQEMRTALDRGVAPDERWHLRKSGERFFANGEMTVLRNAAGVATGFVKVLRDQTEAHRSAQLLSETNAQLRRAETVGAVGIFSIDIARARIRGTPEFFRIYGLPGGPEVAAEDLNALILPEDAAALARQAESPGGSSLTIQYRVRHGETGEVRWISSIAELERDAADQPMRIVGVVQDVTARRAVEEEIAASELRFRTFAQAVPNQVWSATPDGLLDWFNERTFAYSGLLQGDLIGQGWAQIVHPDDLAEATEAWIASLASGHAYETEFRIRRSDGKYRWHLVRALPILGETGDIIRWIGTNTDTEDRRAAAEALRALNTTLEQAVADRTAVLATRNAELAAQMEETERAEAQLRQLQRLEAVGQLTAGVAHDFNNLLTVILGNIGFLEKALPAQGADGKAAQRLGYMRAAAERGATLTAQMLAFSRRQKLEPKAIDLNDSVAGMRDLLRSTLGGSVNLELDLGDNIWPALVDPTQIELIVLNLAINARDAMDVGGRLEIGTANVSLTEPPRRPEEPPPGDYVALSVTDDGEGMSAQVLDRAFEPFFTTKEVGKGSGLGLAQVFGFAAQSGGGVKIKTAEGQGTTVCVFLPRAAAATRSSESGASLAAPLATARRVLVMDDDSAVRQVTAGMLVEEGHTVIEADSALGALEILRTGTEVDILLADYAMPGMNGAEAARQAAVLRPGLPVLFITGFADLTGLRNVSEHQILRKPFRAEDLARKLAGAMEMPSRAGSTR